MWPSEKLPGSLLVLNTDIISPNNYILSGSVKMNLLICIYAGKKIINMLNVIIPEVSSVLVLSLYLEQIVLIYLCAAACLSVTC